MIIPRRILGNLLGKRAKVIFSKDETLIGICGEIVHETREMLEIMTESGKRVKVPKKTATFEILLSDKEKVIIDGAVLARRFRLLRRLGRRK